MYHSDHRSTGNAIIELDNLIKMYSTQNFQQLCTHSVPTTIWTILNTKNIKNVFTLKEQ